MKPLVGVISCVAGGREVLNVHSVETKPNHGRLLGDIFIVDIVEVRSR